MGSGKNRKRHNTLFVLQYTVLYFILTCDFVQGKLTRASVFCKLQFEIEIWPGRFEWIRLPIEAGKKRRVKVGLSCNNVWIYIFGETEFLIIMSDVSEETYDLKTMTRLDIIDVLLSMHV